MTNDNLSQKLIGLEEENRRLREQVKRLMTGENKLYVLQDRLNSQQRIYIRLAEISRELNVSLDVDQILKTVVHFVIYGFSYERCAVFLEEVTADSKRYRVYAHEGYYDNEDIAHISQAHLTGKEPALLDAYGDAGFACQTGETHNKASEALGGIFLMDEYFVFTLKRKERGITGFLVAGNTKGQARYQTAVQSEGEMLTALSNLAAQTAVTLANVQSYRALEEERQLLDRTVDARTRELSEALDAAQEAVRIKAEFLAKVSHELRTPLNSIVNIPGALADDFVDTELYICDGCETEYRADSEEQSFVCPECQGALKKMKTVLYTGSPSEHLRFLRLLEEQGAHLLSIVEDVLDFSKLGSGRMELRYSEVDAARMLEETATTIQGAMRGKNCTIVYPTLTEPLVFTADRLRIKQVLINLVNNAVKFTPDGGTVQVNIRETEHEGESWVAFSVTDTGIGIPEDQLETIFESFRQVDGSHTRTYGGTGLGLAISRQLVEMHGGTIEVSSVLGKGSTFAFRVPLCARTLTESDHPLSPSGIPHLPSERPPRIKGHGTVVVVDDEPAHLSLARKFLERAGYEVTLESDPKNAMEVIRRISPRFVILDIMMPDVNGLLVLSRLRQNDDTKEIPVIVSTAFHYNKKKAEELGAAWLPKPWSAEKLSAVNLEKLLEGRERDGVIEEDHSRSRLVDSIAKILYVEDEDANFEVTALSLRGKYQIDRARDSKETFECLSSSSYDLILMDIQLAGSDLNGIEMCEILTGKRTSDIPDYAENVRLSCPIVIVTAYASLYSKEDMLASGAHDFITKPVDFTHLLIVLSRLMIRGTL